MKKYMTVEMPNGSLWAVPVEMIARDRAKHYAHEYDCDVERSMKEDTIPLFEADTYEIQDWAVGSMDWDDFDGHQIQIHSHSVDFWDEGWVNGDKDFIDEIP